jgi:hypothetical protein
MIYVNQNQVNNAAAVCSRNANISNPVFLWNMVHKLSLKTWNFIPYRIPPNVTTYTPGYDLFSFNIDDSIAEVLTGATGTGQINVHLIPGEYFLRVYEQTSSTNIIPNPDNNYIVYETLVNVVGVNQDNPIVYATPTDESVFIIYNPNND